MLRKLLFFSTAFLLVLSGCDRRQDAESSRQFTDSEVPANHDELESFFLEWREFLKPPMKDGIPEYSD
ncbi:MAG: hypothetical protein P8X57_09675, partial [Cyclobacteriaceae bacterium]